MAPKAQSKAAPQQAHETPQLTAGLACWFTNPKDGKQHEGIYRGGRTVEERTGVTRTTKQTASGEEQVTGFEEQTTTWQVPGSIVIHVGPKPVE